MKCRFSPARGVPAVLCAMLCALLTTFLLAGVVSAEAPRLVILYAPCTVNTDYLSPYNDSVSFTPHLERFAAGSVVFERHQTEAGQSGIAYASLLTGHQSDGHGVYRHPAKLRGELRTLAEAYAEGGYETYFWGHHLLADSKLRYDQGTAPSRSLRYHLRGTDRVFQEILARLRADPDYKAFVFTNFSVTHAIYTRKHLPVFKDRHPQAFAGVRDTDLDRYATLYADNHLMLEWNFAETVDRLGLSDPEVAMLELVVELLFKSNTMALDRLFGEVVREVRAAGLIDESLIVFTADHGEVMHRENAPFRWSHSMQLAPEVLRVPLIVRSPATPAAPGRYQGVTRSIDVFPTMLGLAGLPDEEQVAGVDLSPAMLGRAPPPALHAYSHTTVISRNVYKRMQSPAHQAIWGVVRLFFPSEDPGLMWVSLRDGDHVYKWRNLDGTEWGFEVFDLSIDPRETINLFDRDDAAHGEMAKRLIDYKRRLVGGYTEAFTRGASGDLPAEEELRLLRSLGYVQ